MNLYIKDNIPNDLIDFFESPRGLGLEKTPQEYVANLVNIFNEVYRVLRPDGTIWLNLGDSYSSFKDQSVRFQTVSGKSRDEPSEGLASNRNGKVLKECGLKNKDLIGIPWMTAFALRDAGWYLRSDVIWAKGISFAKTYHGTCMPESIQDRPTRAHEYIFLLTKSPKYYYDIHAIKEDAVMKPQNRFTKRKDHPKGDAEGMAQSPEGMTYCEKRNARSVWAINPKGFKGAHFAVMPEALVEPMVKAGCPELICSKCGFPGTGVYSTAKLVKIKRCDCEAEMIPGAVLDPFSGAGTTSTVAKRLGRRYIGFELNPEYCEISKKRIGEVEFKEPLS